MDTLLSILKDSTWQAYVFSPLAGVLFSLLITPPPGRTRDTRISNSYNHNNSHNHFNSHNNSHNTFNVYADNSTNSSGDFAMMLAITGPAAYLSYAPIALHGVVVATMFIAAMSGILVVRGFATGAIMEGSWILRICVPTAIAVAAYRISQMALQAYYYPSGSGWQWNLMQAMGVFSLCIAMLAATLSLVNSTALLGADADAAGSFRVWVLQATRRFARPVSLVVAVIFTIASPLLINGQAMAWMMSATTG